MKWMFRLMNQRCQLGKTRHMNVKLRKYAVSNTGRYTMRPNLGVTAYVNNTCFIDNKDY